MVAEWYLKVAGKELGPLTPKQLKIMAAKGQLAPDDPVRQGSEGSWVPAGRVKGLLPGAGSAAGESNSSGMPVAKPLEEPPVKIKKRSAAKSKPSSTPVAKPLEEPVAAPATRPPVAVPAPPQAAPPAAVPPTVAPPAVATPTNQFAIDTEPHSPGAIASGRGGAGALKPRKKRQTQTVVVVGLVVLLVGLGVAAAAMILSKKTMQEPAQDPDAVAAQPSTETAPENEGKPEDFDALGGLEEGLAELIGEPKPSETPTEDPAEPEPDTPAATAPDEDTWSDASTSSVTRGDVTVKITAAETGRPTLVRSGTGQRAWPKGDYLVIRLRLQSTNADKKLPYTSWSARAPANATMNLVDNTGTPYLVKSFAGMEAEGQVSGGKGSIYPDQPTEDVLIFERPLKTAKFLRLELPAAAFGEKGLLRFEIPMTMVVAMAEPEKRGLGPGEPAGGDPSEPGVRPRSSDDEPLPPGRGVPAIDRGINEVDSEGEEDQPPPERPEDDPGGIPGVMGAAPADPDEEPEGVVDKLNADIEAVGGGEKDEGEEDFSFSDDPLLKKRHEQFRQQTNPDGNRGNQNRHRGRR